MKEIKEKIYKFIHRYFKLLKCDYAAACECKVCGKTVGYCWICKKPERCNHINKTKQ